MTYDFTIACGTESFCHNCSPGPLAMKRQKVSCYSLASERSERAQSCSCSIEISDTYVYQRVR